MLTKKTTNALLLAGFSLCLFQIWLPAYYLTGDGPCHVYNAQIVYDLWANKNVSFYAPYFTLVYQPNPNWLSTLVISLLMFCVNGIIAEKIFLSVYVFTFISGFYLLLKKISTGDSYWLLMMLIFVFPLTLSKGFYNFSFSIAFYFWVVWSWLRFLEKRSIANTCLFLLFTTLIFFTHLLAFGIAAFTCTALVASFAIAAQGVTKRKFTSYFLSNVTLLAFFLTPFILLMSWFTQKKGGLQIQLRHHFYRLIELVQGKFLINVTHGEDYFALTAGLVLIFLFCFSMIKFKKYRTVNKYDGILVSLLFVTFVYLFFPESFLGTLILISMRAQLFVLILMACCIAYIVPDGKFKNVSGIILFGCFIGLSIIRINCQLSASYGVVDYVSAIKFIKPYSVVLPLDFSPNGKDEQGLMIADRNFLFSHASQYMGLNKPLIFLDNYEANMGYFPLRWNEKTNPYYHLNKGNGIEGQPPCADIAGYKQISGVTIDYILMWCYDTSWLKNNDFAKFYAEINNGYHKVYSSTTERTLLFEKNQ